MLASLSKNRSQVEPCCFSIPERRAHRHLQVVLYALVAVTAVDFHISASLKAIFPHLVEYPSPCSVMAPIAFKRRVGILQQLSAAPYSGLVAVDAVAAELPADRVSREKCSFNEQLLSGLDSDEILRLSHRDWKLSGREVLSDRARHRSSISWPSTYKCIQRHERTYSNSYERE